MMTMKKIGAVLATIIVSLVRFPLTCLAAGLGIIDVMMIKLNVKLTKVIDCEWWSNSMWDAQRRNAHGMECWAEYFEELAEDLA